jgi:hypothetical protein
VSGEDAVAGVLTCRAGGWNYLPPRRFGSCKAFDISRRTHHFPLRTLSPIFLQDWSTWQRIAGYWGASSKNAYPPDQRQLHLGGCFGQQGAEAQLQGLGVLRLTQRTADKAPDVLVGGLLFLLVLQVKKRADERIRTAFLISLRVIIPVWQGFARARNLPISKPLSLLRLAQCCTVLRSRWGQSGIKPPLSERCFQ